jgi:hypothetical protein
VGPTEYLRPAVKVARAHISATPFSRRRPNCNAQTRAGTAAARGGGDDARARGRDRDRRVPCIATAARRAPSRELALLARAGDHESEDAIFPACCGALWAGPEKRNPRRQQQSRDEPAKKNKRDEARLAVSLGSPCAGASATRHAELSPMIRTGHAKELLTETLLINFIVRETLPVGLAPVCRARVRVVAVGVVAPAAPRAGGGGADLQARPRLWVALGEARSCGGASGEGAVVLRARAGG